MKTIIWRITRRLLRPIVQELVADEFFKRDERTKGWFEAKLKSQKTEPLTDSLLRVINSANGYETPKEQ